MVEAVMLWNEPNNLSHWDFKLDPDWKMLPDMVIAASKAIRNENPELPIVLGGISPIDPHFIELLGSYGVLDAVDVVSVHGFPLDWNHWQIQDWPKKIDEIRAVTSKPVWVSEAGVSSLARKKSRPLASSAPLSSCCRSWIACTGTACSICRLRGQPPRGTKKLKAAPTIAITIWDSCVKTVRPNWPLNHFPAVWASANGFTMKILGSISPSIG